MRVHVMAEAPELRHLAGVHEVDEGTGLLAFAAAMAVPLDRCVVVLVSRMPPGPDYPLQDGDHLLLLPVRKESG